MNLPWTFLHGAAAVTDKCVLFCFAGIRELARRFRTRERFKTVSKRSNAPLEFLCVHNPSALLFQGGGITISGGTVNINSCAIHNNQASGEGVSSRAGFELEDVSRPF